METSDDRYKWESSSENSNNIVNAHNLLNEMNQQFLGMAHQNFFLLNENIFKKKK